LTRGFNYGEKLEEKDVVNQPGLAYVSGNGHQRASANVSNWFKRVVVHHLKIIQPSGGFFCNHLFGGCNQSGGVLFSPVSE
jgi:hypothetical protein